VTSAYEFHLYLDTMNNLSAEQISNQKLITQVLQQILVEKPDKAEKPRKS